MRWMLLLLGVGIATFGSSSLTCARAAAVNQILYRHLASLSTFQRIETPGPVAFQQLGEQDNSNSGSSLEFTPDGGVYTNNITVRLQTSIPNGEIRFALAEASSEPDWQVFSGPILLTSPTTVLAQVFENGVAVSEVEQRTFQINPENPVQVEVTTLAGTLAAGYRDGYGTNALFNWPNAGYVGSDQFAYIADSYNHRVRRVDLSTGEAITLAGTGEPGNVDGIASSAQFNVPLGIFVDHNGNVLVADAENNCIRKIILGKTPIVTTVAGSGVEGYADGPAATAQFNFPNDLVVDRAGNIFVSEFWNHNIRKITPDGVVTTFVGNGLPGAANGKGTQAQLNLPAGLAIDLDGNLFVTEWGNHDIRKVTPDGAVTTFAGAGKPGFYDGAGTLARFQEPDGIAIDYTGNLFVTEWGNHAVRKISKDGVVTTLAGNGSSGFTDGEGAAARFYAPGGVGINAFGYLLIADSANQSLRRLRFIGTLQMTVQPQSQMALQGTTVTLHGFAVSSETIQYQWLFNGTRLPVTTNDLVLNNLDSSKAGEYILVASTPSGVSVASAPTTLTVVFNATPVQRDLASAYTPGKRIKVGLRVNPPSGATTYSIEDSPPLGWTVMNIGQNGKYDAANNKIQFKDLSGSDSRVLTYEVVPPLAERRRGVFAGNSFFGATPVPIGGVQTIDVVLLHPADVNPSDGRLSNDEVAAYGQVWRKSGVSDSEALAIPIDYLTRAGMLWKRGEFYYYDSTVVTAPLWWVADENPAETKAAKSRLSLSKNPSAIRHLSASSIPNGPMQIQISIETGDTAAYAVQEELPAGSQVSNISDGGEWDAQNSRIKWGPFYDSGGPPVVSYAITPSSNRATEIQFLGTASFDGTSVSVGGQQQVRVGGEITSIQRLAEGKYRIDLRGWLGTTCRIEASSNLTDWTLVATLNNNDGVLIFDDPAATGEEQRFYRLVLQ